MTGRLDQWLARTRETALEPGIPIIDAHHHLWDYPQSRYLIADLMADMDGGHNVCKTVFVECLSGYREEGPDALRPVGETEFVAGLAADSDRRGFTSTSVAAGIVGFADLRLGEDVAPVLEAHMTAGDGRFRGIRHASGWDPSPQVRNSHTTPPPELFAEAGFRKGFSLLSRYDLSFDAWLYHLQLMELAELAGAFPETRIILDHAGGPLGIGPYAGRRDSVFEQWQQGLDAVSARENVVVKLGGLAMSICGFGWHRQEKPPGSNELAAAMAPYFEHCLERFGVRRCMFESNFPVDRVSCGYTVLWNAFKQMTQSFSESERAALFHDTAARIYRI